MKKLIISLALVLAFCGCSRDIEGLNKNHNDPTYPTPEGQFTNAQKAIVDAVFTPDYHSNLFRFFAQYWTQTTYTDESNYDMASRKVSEHFWNAIYPALGNLRDAQKGFKDESSGDSDVRNNKLQIAEIMSVYAWTVLVDTYGDVPYRKALGDDTAAKDGLYSEALDITNETPKYDDAAKIYKDLANRLIKACSALKPDKGSFTAKEENIYQGNVGQWLKFANSLKLRMAITLSDADRASALSLVSSIKGDLIIDNPDNATLDYMSAVPNTNPTYMQLVATGRQDYLPAKTFVDVVNQLKDPREKYFFQDNKIKLDENAKQATKPEIGQYKGLLYGQRADAYDNYTHINENITKETYPGTILSAAEVEFLKAEAIERGYSIGGGTAAEHYKKAIERSFEEWGSTATAADKYINDNPSVQYDANKWKERIGMQAWIALYNRGFAGWLSWRRLDIPVLEGPHAKGDKPTQTVPVRYTYPIFSQNNNDENVAEAAKRMDGQKLSTKVFWDKNNQKQ